MSEQTTAGQGVVNVGAVADFPIDSFRILDIDGIEVGVLHTSDDYWIAARNICPHRYAPVCRGSIGGTMMPSPESTDLVYGLDKRVLRCPWHHWEFDLTTGHALFGIAKGRLKLYPVEVVDDQVWVRMKARRTA